VLLVTDPFAVNGSAEIDLTEAVEVEVPIAEAVAVMVTDTFLLAARSPSVQVTRPEPVVAQLPAEAVALFTVTPVPA
jgi:hypothetical protein